MNLKHFLITRFSYREGSALKYLDGPGWKVTKDPLHTDRLEKRFKIFESTCLPGVLGQTDKSFTWIIIIDEKLPLKFKSKLACLVESRKESIIHIYSSGDKLHRLDWLSPYLDRIPDYILTTNIDDDDVLPNNYIATLHKHISTTIDEGNLPPAKLLGTSEIIQWDMINSRRAPLGMVSSWHRGKHVTSCGLSLLVKYPQLPFCVLGIKHFHADRLFDFDIPPKNRNMKILRAEFVAASDAHNLGLANYSGREMYHEVGADTGPVLVTNHDFNDQQWRLYEGKSDIRPVTGNESFPNLSVDLVIYKKYSKAFRRGWKDLYKSRFGLYFKDKFTNLRIFS